MKILQIIYESLGSPFGFGGAGIRAYEVYKRLSDRHEITLLCMKYPGARDGEIQGLKHLFVGTENTSLTSSVLAYTFKASRFVRKYGGNYDVIVENFLPSTPFFSRLLTNTPVVLQVQGVMYKHSFRKFSPIYALPMYVFERCYPSLYDRFIFVSDVTKEKVMRGVKGPVKICRVIPNGINEELLEVEPTERDYILFFSRIDVYTKGLDLLLTAFEELASDVPDLRLIMAGHEADSFAELTAGFPEALRRRVKYAGFLTGAGKTDLLSRAIVVVLPSRHESSPVSIMEAAACGKPLIVSDIAELKFVVENNFGLSFPSGSAGGLKEKMGLLLKDKRLRNELAIRGREFSKNFLWDRIAGQFENVLECIVHEKN